MSRYCKWCFTICNWTASDQFGVAVLFKDVEYGIVGEEICPTTGTPHLQGYVRLLSGRTMKVMSKCLPRARLIQADGDDFSNKTYCSKEGKNIKEVGVPVKDEQGKRSDIHELTALIRAGEITLTDTMFEFPILYLKYSRSIEKMFDAVMKPRDRTVPPTVIWLHGKAGVGKTRYVEDRHATVYKKDNTPWWDRYVQQDAICIDDFDNDIPYRTLLRILDRYEYLGQVKGSYVQVNSPFIYITCEFPPEHYWSGNTLAQVTRRITSLHEIK